MIAPDEQVLQFKITLNNITPQIWRRIQVLRTYTFWDLHVAIQDSMGWLDYHLHEFKINDPLIGDMIGIGIPDPDMMSENDMLPGWELDIAAYFSLNNPEAEYIYDFGDGWRHTVEFEKVVSRDRKIIYPICVGGKRACPPEDCGGNWGYENMLRVLSDPTDDEHADMLAWVGGEYDPEYFNSQEVKFDDPRQRWDIAFRQG